MQTIEIDGNRIDMEFVRKPWIRNTYLKFVDSTLVITSRNRNMLHKAIEEHAPWISKHYMEIKSTTRLFEANSIFYRSQRYQVERMHSASRPRSDIVGSRMLVYAPTDDSAERLLDRIIREDTRRLSGEIALKKAGQIGESFSEIKVRKCRKWGACKSDRKITLNYVISMLPYELQDYIISHEVAHLKEMNHSGRFWEVVGRLCPDYRNIRRQLRGYDSRRRPVFGA